MPQHAERHKGRTFLDVGKQRTYQGHRRAYGGLYRDPTAAERGIRRFRDSGYEGQRIGIISRDRDEAKEVAENIGASAAAGAVAGGLLGGLAGLLVGGGALAIPSIGPVIAGGALASAFGIGGGTAVDGVGIGAGVGAVGGGLLGALTHLGFEKDEAECYDTGVRNGPTLVTAHDDGRSESIFDETGAERYRRSTTGTSFRVI